MPQQIQFDWSQGRAFVQDGTIYYSPNCSRTVLIPSERSVSSPFNVPRLDVSMFKQPVWWSDVYGWQAFIPLAPSYTSSPFEPFCWMPRIVEVKSSHHREILYEMEGAESHRWRERENLLVTAAEQIRIWYKIPGNMPPRPSHFNYESAHKSYAVAKKMISLARDWFAVWMGFVSYLLSSTERYSPSSSSAYSKPDPNSPFPVWYSRLEERHNYPAAWLDGLTSSTVCSYNMQTTPRVGVVFQWSNDDVHRPPIEWFHSCHIPMWFVWSSAEEQRAREDRSYSFLQPPEYLIQEALTKLFVSPNVKIPLAGLIMQRYYSLGSDPMTNETVKLLALKYVPSFVLRYTTKVFLDQDRDVSNSDPSVDAALRDVLKHKQAEQYAASRAEAAIPTQTMLDMKDKGRLYNHWEDYFAARLKRHQEKLKVETPKERQTRLSRERNPGVKNADIFTWKKIQSSGGKELYMRLKVDKTLNATVHGDFQKHHRIFNPFDNEWDLCKEFGHESNMRSQDSDSEDDVDKSDYETDDGGDDQRPVFRDPSIPLPDSNPTFIRASTPPQLDDMDMTEDDDSPAFMDHYSRNVVETLSYGYGYVPSLPGMPVIKVSDSDWENMLVTLGFVRPFAEFDVQDHERRAIFDFYVALLKKTTPPLSFDDLNDKNHAALRHLFDFPAIHHPSSDLFVFSAPRSTASDWLLGVESAEIALYVCRYILSNPTAHTLLTIAARLLNRGVPFRTLLGLDCSSRHTTVVKSYQPSSYRFSNHVFSRQDFDTYRLQCRTLLSRPQGRAALLKGGIIWRIAKEFLSMDEILAGPSVEVTLHRVGYIHSSGTPNVEYCDDELTEDELALICGTYSLYTATKGQVSVKSWFPPPVCWSKSRTGVQWIEWTQRNEQFFVDWLDEVCNRNGQPKTVVEWTSRLRGLQTSRALRDNNRARAAAFMGTVISN